ncbi:hypothetical protein M3210_03065 [Oceanobacillus luteolus]|uniref:hypothetical protein n=1 Tax=Oceanobacillus luteolus TaxID=1274358 RepID=UPI00203EEB2C|nr:hypothetical protein [Oceanobacillus luteolus]MCM3739244.1 hypothetical protein [Oceanobacillus luteolus]
MKLTIQDAYDITQGLKGLLDKELPTSVAFSIQRNFKKIGEEVGNANEVRNKLAKKYKEFTDDDGYFTDDKKKSEYNKELNELMRQEIEVELNILKLSDLGDYIKPRTLGLIEKIIEEDE